MGTSILFVFISPALFFGVAFSDISGAIFGYPTEEIVLPYDEEKGLVWEYDCVNDPDIELVETKVENGEQIFSFVSKGSLDWNTLFMVKDENDPEGDAMDLIFTDKNGNEKVYYGFGGNRTSAPVFYLAEECQTLDITLTAENPKENASWEAVDSTGYVLMKKSEKQATETFTVVITPGNKKGEYATFGTFDVVFAYTDSSGSYYEKATAKFVFSDGTHTLEKVTYEEMTGIRLLDFVDIFSILSVMG